MESEKVLIIWRTLLESAITQRAFTLGKIG